VRALQQGGNRHIGPRALAIICLGVSLCSAWLSKGKDLVQVGQNYTEGAIVCCAINSCAACNQPEAKFMEKYTIPPR